MWDLIYLTCIALAVYHLPLNQQHPYAPGWNRAARLRLDTVRLD
jgi:hypothetical protein